MGKDVPETHSWGTRGLQRPRGNDCPKEDLVLWGEAGAENAATGVESSG